MGGGTCPPRKCKFLPVNARGGGLKALAEIFDKNVSFFYGSPCPGEKLPIKMYSVKIEIIKMSHLMFTLLMFIPKLEN